VGRLWFLVLFYCDLEIYGLGVFGSWEIGLLFLRGFLLGMFKNWLGFILYLSDGDTFLFWKAFQLLFGIILYFLYLFCMNGVVLLDFL
jgi:hypothetical protein